VFFLLLELSVLWMTQSAFTDSSRKKTSEDFSCSSCVPGTSAAMAKDGKYLASRERE